MNQDILELTDLDDGGILMETDFGAPPPASNSFGGGLELLMNNQQRESRSSNLRSDDIADLEAELNQLTDTKPASDHSSSSSSSTVAFADDGGSQLGKSSAADHGGTQFTWDGFSKLPDTSTTSSSIPEVMSSSSSTSKKEASLIAKMQMVEKLKEFQRKGEKFEHEPSEDMPFERLKAMYEISNDKRQRTSAIKFQRTVFLACVNGLEMLNHTFDPFDLDLDGLGEQTQENIKDYDDIFAELYEKYKDTVQWTPELKLLFTFVGNACMLNMTNKFMKSAMPTADDLFRQNPDLLRSFQQSAVQQMAAKNPGFGNFATNIMGVGATQQHGPPPPMPTQGPNAPPPPTHRPGNNDYAQRPDLQAATSSSSSSTTNNTRPEMRGPSDLSNILAGMKAKHGGGSDQEPKRSGARRKRTAAEAGENTISLDI